MSNFESSVKVIPYSQERVYNKLSDLSNLEAVKDRLPKDKVQDLSFDSDTLSFSVSPIGQLTLQIVERDPCKCIKLATTNSPLPFNMWIQLVETAEEEPHSSDELYSPRVSADYKRAAMSSDAGSSCYAPTRYFSGSY